MLRFKIIDVNKRGPWWSRTTKCDDICRSDDQRRLRIDNALQWRHNKLDGVSNHRRLDYWLNRLFRRRSKKASKLRVTGLCEGNSPVTGKFPSQRASIAEIVSIWWRHHMYEFRMVYGFTAWRDNLISREKHPYIPFDITISHPHGFSFCGFVAFYVKS